MRLEVSFEVRGVGELHRTHAAGERAVVVVQAHMFLEVGRLCELALTDGAGHVWPVDHVSVDMTPQRRGGDEARAAQRTPVRPFSCTDMQSTRHKIAARKENYYYYY